MTWFVRPGFPCATTLAAIALVLARRAAELTQINADRQRGADAVLPSSGFGGVTMNAQDAMTNDVVTVGPETTVGEIAALLVRHRISAVPVVTTDKRVVGIVS